MKSPIYLVLLLALLPMSVFAEKNDAHHKNSAPTGVESLSKELRGLLSEEMKAIQTGMMSVIPAYVSGDWAAIASTAGKIKNSYILKQSLSDSQIKELHSALPKEFIAKDKRFHYLAGMLEHAAKNKKPELINFYFSEMNESCASCHAVYATHKFPNFKDHAKKDHSQKEHAH